ncbi:MAG: hypothetical protein U9R79_10400 [Armatimonadota bacterium]|nr:hypothetical protein [Armatimonadota bacterium]
MGFTDWRALTSDGDIADLPASGFRYKYIQDITIYLSDTAGAGAALAWSALGLGTPTPGFHAAQVRGTWRLHIDDPAGNRLFEQEVTLTYTFAAILISMFGGVAMSLWTWWLSGEDIDTTICGHELEEGEKPPTLGVEEGYGDPAGGSDYGTNWAKIMTEWVSPSYLVAIPDGSQLDIDFHNFGLDKLRPSLAAIQTQVLAAAGAFWRNPGMGMIFGARGAVDGGMEARAWHAPRNAPPTLAWERSVWESSTGQSSGRAVWVPHVGRGQMALLWQGYGGVLYAESDNMGDVDGWEGPVTVLAGHTLLGADRDDDGVLYILARNSDGQVVGYKGSRSGSRDTLLHVGPAVPCMLVDGTPLSITSLDMFQVDDGVAYAVVDTGADLDYYEGLNGMALWRRHVDDEEGQ